MMTKVIQTHKDRGRTPYPTIASFIKSVFPDAAEIVISRAKVNMSRMISSGQVSRDGSAILVDDSTISTLKAKKMSAADSGRMGRAMSPWGRTWRKVNG